MTNREQTFPSPYCHSPNAENYAKDPFSQWQLVSTAMKDYLSDPFEKSEDLRGAKFEVQMHEDGLHVTIRQV